jgi:hypothetical protein
MSFFGKKGNHIILTLSTTQRSYQRNIIILDKPFNYIEDKANLGKNTEYFRKKI